MRNLISDLESNGIVITETTESEFISLARSIGKPIPSRVNSSIVDNLQPKPREQAHAASLSKIYGIHQFPYHTDGAYFTIPPKFICLRYAQGVENPTPTNIFNVLKYLDDVQKRNLSKEFYTVKGRQFSFYTSILEKRTTIDQLLIRYDPGCMRSINDSTYFETIFNDKMKEHFPLIINWYIGKTLIINNWQFLHSRPSVEPKEINFRTLQRIMLNE